MIRYTAASRSKRRWIGILGIVLLPAALELWGCGGGVSSPTAPSNSITVSDPSSATSLTYGANIAPILASDCTYCHSSSNRSGGYDLSSYSGVLRTLAPGNANSLLIQVTRPGGRCIRTSARLRRKRPLPFNGGSSSSTPRSDGAFQRFA